MHAAMEDAELLRDIYVCIESLRNSYDLLLGHVGAWVRGCVRFVERREDHWVETRKDLFNALGVDPELVEVLAEKLQLCYEDGHLLVWGSMDRLEELVQVIQDNLIAVWRFVRWSASRFLTVGTCARTVVTALITGIDGVSTIHLAGQGCVIVLPEWFRPLDSRQEDFSGPCCFGKLDP